MQWLRIQALSANDAHKNVGMIARWAEGDRARVEDPLGKLLMELPMATIPPSILSREGKTEGDELFRLVFDPYECSLRHVGTHLLVSDFSERGVRKSLEEGRAFVAFDWLADATGFDFAAGTDCHKGTQRTQARTQWRLA